MKRIPCFLFLSAVIITSCQQQQKSPSIKAIAIARGEVPSLAIDTRGTIHLAYGQGNSILYSISTDKGESYSVPEQVDNFPDLFSFAMRGPQVATIKDGACILACNKAGDIFCYRKVGASQWQRTQRVNDADTIAKEGFVAVDSDGENKLFAAWLDLRDDNNNKIYGARSADGGLSWSGNLLVYRSPDGHVCECCKPSVQVHGDSVHVMFRNWLDGNRDLYLASSRDNGNSFPGVRKLGEGSWKLDGCPMDGGGLALGHDGSVETVFRRQSSVYAVQPGRPEEKIGEGKSCTMETINGRNVYAWIEEGEIVIKTPKGEKLVLGQGKSPVLKSIDENTLICVWENEKQIYASKINL